MDILLTHQIADLAGLAIKCYFAYKVIRGIGLFMLKDGKDDNGN